MQTKRIIPCLDIKDGRTVKGVNFVNLRDAGSAVELAKLYSQQGADELTFLDISATEENRSTLLDLVRQIGQEITIPFTVGGGIRSTGDVAQLLSCGADKISINTQAVRSPSLIDSFALQFGSKRVVCAIDVKRSSRFDTETELGWEVFVQGGKIATGLEAVAWAQEVAKRGCGEILLTSMEHDGVKQGFALDITRRVAEAVEIPIIASGGAGSMEHFVDVFTKTKAEAALAASIFHFHEIDIPELKIFLAQHGIPMRTRQ